MAQDNIYTYTYNFFFDYDEAQYVAEVFNQLGERIHMWAWPFPQMKQPESPKYRPKSTEPVGSWLTKEKNAWICKCWANLDYERHGKDEFICEKCKWQQPIS